MKKLFFSIITFALFQINFMGFAQAPPEGINYQAIARDTAGKVLGNSTNLVVRFSIWPDSTGTGTSLFTETHSPVNTNRYGLFTLVIGSVNITDFQNIIWSVGDKFLEVEIATVGGSGYVSMGKTQLMSVPYALHSKASDFAINNWSLQGNNLTNTTDYIGTSNSQDLIIKTDGTERIRVKSNGKVGIGTTSPSALFSVGAASEFQVDSTGAIDTATGITSSGNIIFSGLSQNGVVRTIVNNGTLSSSGGPINLASEVSDTLPVINGGTGLGSLGNWQAFYSDSLGALTPFSLGAAGTVFQSNGIAVAPTWVSPSSLMQNLTQGTGISTFTYNGSSAANVAIAPTGISAGTYNTTLTGQTLTIPTFTVNAQGQLTAVSFPTVNVEVPLTFNNGLSRTSNNVQWGGPLVQNTVITGGAFNTLFDLSSTGNFSINKNGGTSAFFIDPTNGNAGIGTDTPTGKFHINNDVAGSDSSLVVLQNGNVGIGTDSPTGKFHINNDLVGSDSSLVVLQNGNVGIGTATPVHKLDVVSGNIATNQYMYINTWLGTYGTGFGRIWFDGVGGLGDATGYLSIGANDDSHLNIQVGGNVGIGTTGPSTQLHTTGGVRFQNLTGTETRFVVTDLNGNLSAGSATTAGIVTGSGTLNYVPKWTPDGATLANSSIFDNGNVGIGTATPAHKLDVVSGNIATNQYMYINSWLGTYGTGFGRIWYDGVGGLGDATGYLSIGANDDSHLNIQVGGNVGIGTTSPTAKLHILGSSQNTLAIESPAYPEITHRVSGVIKSYNAIATSAGGYFTGSAVDDWIFGNEGSGSIKFGKSSTTHVTISNIGNVGIGTITPAQMLHISKTNNASKLLIETAGVVSPQYDQSLEFKDMGGSWFLGQDYTVSTLQFGIGRSSLKSDFTINSTGNVGIGTTTPGNKFEVNSGTANVSGQRFTQFTNTSGTSTNTSGNVLSVDATGNIIMVADQTTISAGVIGGVGANNYIARWSSLNTLGTGSIYDNGNVGIGTITPSATLAVGANKFLVDGLNGDVTFTDDLATITFPVVSGANAPMMYKFPSGTSNADRMVIAHSPGFPTWGLQYQDAPDKFNFLSNGTPVLTADLGAQKVGIGTSSPVSKLDVEGGISIGTAYSGSTAAPLNGAIIEGNVGIGTSSPVSKLDIEGGISVGATYSGSTAAPLNGAIIEGKVGIGETNPLTSLEVNGAITYTPLSANYSTDTVLTPGNRGYIKMTSTIPIYIKNMNAGVKAGQMLILENAFTNTISILDGNGIQLDGNVDYIMEETDTLTLIWSGTQWLEIGRGENN